MLDVLEMKAAARLKLTQPSRPPAAIEGKSDSCNQMPYLQGREWDVQARVIGPPPSGSLDFLLPTSQCDSKNRNLYLLEF